tara:strand:+ start:6703 stop:9414 length:2712 start_codon:yes stop_codon:yes gene_type:complete
MPKIPTFQAEGSIEQLAGTTSNIKINPNSNIFSALKPVTDAVVNFKIKENDAQNKTEALKLENDFITDMQKVYDEVNVLENKEIANQILKTKSNSLIEKYKANATNGSVQDLFNNYALAEVQKGIFRTNTQISKNILTSLDNNVALKEKRLLTTAFLAEGNFDYVTLENDLTNLYTTNYKGKIPNANLKKIIDFIPSKIEVFEATKMIIDNPKLAWLKLNDDKQFPNLNLDTRIDLIQDAKGVLLPMVQNDWSNFLLAASLGKEIDFDMEFAKEIIEPKVFNKMLQQYDSLKNSVANVAIINSISNVDISETIEGFNEIIDNEVETGVKTFKEGNDEKNIYLKAVVARNTAMDSNPVLFITQTNDDVKKLVEELETIDAVKNNELYLQKKLALVNKFVETQINMGQPPYKIKVMSISEADSFVTRYNNGDSKTRVAMLANLEAEFGEYNSQAMLQLSNAGLPITAELSSFFGNPTITNRFINYDQKEEQEKLKKFAKDNNIDFKEIQENISAEIQEFEDIIARNNNVNTSKAIAKLHNIKKVLAYDVLNSMWIDENQDQGDAEEKAASLIKDHFVIEDTYYVPTIYNGEDIKHTIEADTGIVAKADLIQKHYLDEFDAVAFESDNKDVTEVQLTEEMKEQMEDNGEWRNTADGNGLIFGIVFPDDSFAPVKNADGEFLTFNFDDTSLTLPGTNIELEYSKKIESDYYASFAGGNYASRNIVAMNEAMEIGKETKNILTNEKIVNDWGTLYQTTNDPKKNKRALKAISKDYKVPDEAVKAIDAASTVFEGDKNLSKKELIEYGNAIGQIESGYKTKVQIGGGPARSYWQVEPKTALDLLKNSSAIFGKKFEKLFSGKSKYKYSSDGQSAVKYLSSLSEEKMSILLERDDTLAAVMALAVIVNRK